MVTAAITSVSGASAVFEYSAVTYANRIKEQMLGVRRETLSAYGAVSAQTACEMAKGIAAAADADMGLAVTGIAGPTGGTPEKPVGTVYIAVFQNGKCECERLNLLDECGEDRRSHPRSVCPPGTLARFEDAYITDRFNQLYCEAVKTENISGKGRPERKG